jgi:phosphate/sulfate permease
MRMGSLLAVGAPVTAAAIFVVMTSHSLPIVVASHFGPGGTANGFMPHKTYVRFTLAFVVLMPLLLNLVAAAVARLPEKLVNIPNRQYWLAPERRAQAVEMLRGRMQLFAAMLVAFLCYVHWLVVRANAQLPPVLDNKQFVTGLAVFLFALVVWIVSLRRKFRPPVT